MKQIKQFFIRWESEFVYKNSRRGYFSWFIKKNSTKRHEEKSSTHEIVAVTVLTHPWTASGICHTYLRNEGMLCLWWHLMWNHWLRYFYQILSNFIKNTLKGSTLYKQLSFKLLIGLRSVHIIPRSLISLFVRSTRRSYLLKWKSCTCCRNCTVQFFIHSFIFWS